MFILKQEKIYQALCILLRIKLSESPQLKSREVIFVEKTNQGSMIWFEIKSIQSPIIKRSSTISKDEIKDFE